MNKVVVLIPHFNNPLGLKKSLGSIAVDEEVDILIIDDGSKNGFIEEEIKRAFYGKGSVYFLYLKKNSGIQVALNYGLKYIQTKNYSYIARLDCDDLCINNRFYKQSNFLDQNPKVHLIGSFVEAISTEGKYLYTIKMPTSHHQIKKRMYFKTMFIHPTVMFRKNALSTVGYYPNNYDAAEDYAFFFKFIVNFQTSVYPEVLVKVQMDDTGISAVNRIQQVKSRIKVIKDNFYFGYFPIAGLLRSYILLYTPRFILKKIKILLSKF